MGDVTIAQVTTVTATFALQTFIVTIGKIGSGTGTVTGSGIACGSTCTATVSYGTAITLNATPTTLSNFVGWGGPCSGIAMCTATITATTTITAAFALDDITLLVTRAGNGTGTVTSAPVGISCGADCAETYLANTMVTLTAAPAAGSTFIGWSGAGCAGAATCTVTMTAAALVTATFTLDTHSVDVMKAGTGAGIVRSTPAGIACGSDCTEIYNYNTVLTLTAMPSVGSTFVGWSGGGCAGTSTCIVTITAAITVTATFTLNRYVLSAATSGTGAGTVTSTPAGIACGADCSELYTHGSMVTLTAVPAVSSTFAGWSGACTGTAVCTVTMTAARSVTATFTLNTYALSVGLLGAGTGTVSSTPPGISCGADCTEVYPHGTLVTLTAAASVGSVFVGWGGACSGMGACTVGIDAAKSVTSKFDIVTFTITVKLASQAGGAGSVADTGSGIACGADCTEVYGYGTVVTLTATAAPASNFTGWSGGTCTGLAACTVTITSSTMVTATFSAPNIMFVTSQTFGGSFAGGASSPQDMADGLCQQVAGAANLVGSTPGHNTAFRAWVSSTSPSQGTIDAISRFPGSNGWIRPGDWLPIVAHVGDFAANKVWYPPRMTELGTDVGADQTVWTGSGELGLYSGSACDATAAGASTSWSATNAKATTGLSSANASPVISFLDQSCATSRRLYCLGVGRDTSVGAPPVVGKLVFTTAGTWAPATSTGIIGADALCNAEASAASLPGAGTYKALLTPNGDSAITRFVQDGRPWVRVGDLQPITAAEATLYGIGTTVIDVAPNTTATGNRLGNVSIWTGARSVTEQGNSGDTCGDWRNPAELKGASGFAYDTGMATYWFGALFGDSPCFVARHVVCMQP